MKARRGKSEETSHAARRWCFDIVGDAGATPSPRRRVPSGRFRDCEEHDLLAIYDRAAGVNNSSSLDVQLSFGSTWQLGSGPNQRCRLFPLSEALVNSSRAPDDDPTLIDQISL